MSVSGKRDRIEGRIYLKKGKGPHLNNATGLVYPTFTSGFRGGAMRGTEGRGLGCEQARHPTGLYPKFTRAPPSRPDTPRSASSGLGAHRVVWRSLTLVTMWGKSVRRGSTRTSVFPPTVCRRRLP